MAIIDLLLPDVHGVEVCRRLREWSEMPILDPLGARRRGRRKIEALQQGADDYVTKPFGPGELVARVQAAAAARRRERRASRASRPHGLVVDLAAHAVWVDGEEVHLTPIEFSLLRMLVAQPRAADDPPPAARRGVGAASYADATPLLRTHIANLRAQAASAAGAHALVIRTESGSATASAPALTRRRAGAPSFDNLTLPARADLHASVIVGASTSRQGVLSAL